MDSNSQREGNGRNTGPENWSHIQDPAERRRVQNRIAQRSYRVRKKEAMEEQARIAENERSAGASYTAPEPEDLADNDNPKGLPWGSYSFKHAVEAGKAKEARSHATSREGSEVGSSSKAGAGGGTLGDGSRRPTGIGDHLHHLQMTNLGLQLPRSWATGAPAWQMYWRRW